MTVYRKSQTGIIEAVENCTDINLAVAPGKLGNIGNKFLIWLICRKVTPYQII